ncbi:alpha/beta fold hydrolase [Vitiosangium sp. GDMCC 1.1324]|uniref:alpha/beta fold hydrolase n=1 Tax=Vitiosangium sp. (strain GDMCC 1.1324) TaxID=2138576 RepID=UPI000D374F32|nr:alpha/beta hydrolase [Vitiosangium sp. GDMCC 1.1324]PTL85609.1 alpha/beta hydrolase [Vitiosangium sp. GDMCC 1.1324]
MPFLDVNGTRLYYEDTGGSGEPIVFSHGLLWSGRMFDKQVAALKDRYRCITYDHRGQGQSDIWKVDTVDMETVYADAVGLIEKLGVGPCHFVGLSMGGFVGMRLAARRPDLLRSLVLLETSADPEPEQNVPRYNLLNFIVRWFGARLVAKPVMRIMFGRTFLESQERAAERAEWKARLLGLRRDVWRAVNGVIRRRGVYDELPLIKTPTLVLVGEEDVATVPAKSERIHAAIEGSKLVKMPRGGHTSTVEEPELVNPLLMRFLDEMSSGNRQAG